MFGKRLNENGPELSVVNLGPGSGLRVRGMYEKATAPARSLTSTVAMAFLWASTVEQPLCGKDELQVQKSFHVTNLLYSAAKSVKLQAPVGAISLHNLRSPFAPTKGSA